MFLLIKRALVRYPTYAPPEINSFLKLLLEKDGDKRLMNALGGGEEEMGTGTGSKIKSKGICYDFLRGHDFFALGNRCVCRSEEHNTVHSQWSYVTIYKCMVLMICVMSYRVTLTTCCAAKCHKQSLCFIYSTLKHSRSNSHSYSTLSAFTTISDPLVVLNSNSI